MERTPCLSSSTSRRSRLSTSSSTARPQSSIINYQGVDFGQLLKQLAVAAVSTADTELIEQARQTHVVGAVTLAPSLVRQSAGQPRLAHARGAGQQHVLMASEPLAAQKTLDQGLIKSARMPVVDVFGSSVRFEIGALQAQGQGLAVTLRGLMIDQQAEPFIKAEMLQIQPPFVLRRRTPFRTT